MLIKMLIRVTDDISIQYTVSTTTYSVGFTAVATSAVPVVVVVAALVAEV